MDDSTLIGELPLPGRTRLALVRAGYMTLGDLRALDPKRDPLGPFIVPGIGEKGENAVVHLLRTVEQSEQAEAPKPGSGANGLANNPVIDPSFGGVSPLQDVVDAFAAAVENWIDSEADRPLTKDERRDEIAKFCSWFIDEADGLMFACDDGFRRHEVSSDKDIETLIATYYAYEQDQGCAAAEAAYEQAPDR